MVVNFRRGVAIRSDFTTVKSLRLRGQRRLALHGHRQAEIQLSQSCRFAEPPLCPQSLGRDRINGQRVATGILLSGQ